MFSRGSRSSGRHARTDRSRRESQREQSRPLADDLPGAGEHPGSPAGDPGGEDDAAPEPGGAGPYDLSEIADPSGSAGDAGHPAGGRWLDLGSLRIPSVSGVEMRVQANQEGVVQQVFLVHGESVLQLGVFAAPRTEPIWDEVRADIRRSLFDDGVAVEEVEGTYGTELRARVRTQDGLKDLRFVGVNGPRWMVRAVYQGPAAADPSQAGPLAECLRGIVVDRGTEARPVKEPLPLQLSPEMAAQVPADQSGARAAGASPPGRSSAAAGAPPTTTVPAQPATAGPASANPAPASPAPASPAGPAPAGPSAAGPTGAGPSPAGPPATGAPATEAPATGAPATGAPRRKPSPRPRRQAPEAASGPEPTRG